MRLVYKGTNRRVKIDDVVKTFNGAVVKVVRIVPPHKPSSTGRVVVRHADTERDMEYFPAVINAEWIERTDQE
jgi:hypothetical protein